MRLWSFLVPLGVAAACGDSGGASDAGDAGSDAHFDATTYPADCMKDTDCPPNFECVLPPIVGCSAKWRSCRPKSDPCAPSQTYCACDATEVESTCSGGFPRPVLKQGSCPDAMPVACEVLDVTGFTVTPASKTESATNACTSGQIASLVTACFSASATPQTCAAWEADAGACKSCLITADYDSAWGVIVCDSSNCHLNTTGCGDIVSGEVALEKSNGGSGSCGDRENAVDQCVAYACAACTTPEETTACHASSMQAECKSYVDAQMNAPECAIDAGTKVCSPQTDSEWATLINLFCGTGP